MHALHLCKVPQEQQIPYLPPMEPSYLGATVATDRTMHAGPDAPAPADHAVRPFRLAARGGIAAVAVPWGAELYAADPHTMRVVIL